MKKKVLLQVMGAVLVAGLMAGCGGTNDTKTEENTKTEAAADNADAKEETDSTEAEDTSEDSASTDSAEEDSAEADDTAAEAESTGEDSASSDSTEADSAEVADSKETEAAGSSAGTAAQTANSDAYGEVVSAAGWNITVDVEINSSLENVSVELGYTGVETSDYKKEADAGKNFCMIKLKIEKDGSKETLDWANLKLTDSEGNEYSRMDDEFISELGMTRMAGTTLNFGSNEGWIAFEIDENAEGLELSYPFEAEEYHCAL